MSPVRQAAHWIGSVLIFKANHWEFGSSMLLRHTHVASWQVIFEKPSKCTSIQIFKCSLFSCGFFKPLTFANKNHGRFTCQQGKKCSVDASAVRFFFVVKLNWSAEVAEREEPGNSGSSLPGSFQLEIGNVYGRWPPTIVTNEVTYIRPPINWPNENG